MKIEKIRTYGWESAFKGMRNPKNSWRLSDSYFGLDVINSEHLKQIADKWNQEEYTEWPRGWSSIAENNRDKLVEWLNNVGVINRADNFVEYALIGPKDMKLAKTLIRAGAEHRKFLRQIFVSFDLTAPLYIFKEFDTYKIGTTANSTSTMHKLAETPITIDCFEIDDYEPDIYIPAGDSEIPLGFTVDEFLNFLEGLRKLYLKTNKKKYWKELIRWLPESWLQTRTVTMSYENIYNMIHQRRNHKLTEWHYIIDELRFNLPYADELLFENFK